MTDPTDRIDEPSGSQPSDDTATERLERPAAVAVEPAGGAERAAVLPAQTVERGDEERTLPIPESDVASQRAADEPAAVRAEPAPPPHAPLETPEVPPAGEPLPARRHGNRLAASAWVLLAAGLFEVLYLAALFLYVLVEGGPDAVSRSVQLILPSPFAWVPVLVFAVLYELTVLALGRAGRFAYVVTGLVVGLLVYLLSTALVLLVQQGGIGDTRIIGQVLIAPQFILAGVIAREVMLWTGFAVGARGHRLRDRERADHDRSERDRFEHDRYEQDAAVAG